MKSITIRVDIWYDAMLQESYRRTYYNLTIAQALCYGEEMAKRKAASVTDFLASYSIHIERLEE